jgi:16S rRNA U1498 N3-methylase RsmE
MELIIQKTTELGASAIVPFRSKRSISRRKGCEAEEIPPVARDRHQGCSAVEKRKVPQVEAYRSFEEALELARERG